MKEFSYNYIMGGWLSFIGNKSLQHNIDELGKNNYPDENYAREISKCPGSASVYVSAHIVVLIGTTFAKRASFSIPVYSATVLCRSLLLEHGRFRNT